MLDQKPQHCVHHAQLLKQAERQAVDRLGLLIEVETSLAGRPTDIPGRQRDRQFPAAALVSRPEAIRCLIRCRNHEATRETDTPSARRGRNRRDARPERTAYLDAYGRNGGKPLTDPGLERFLPWTADPVVLRARAQPPSRG